MVWPLPFFLAEQPQALTGHYRDGQCRDDSEAEDHEYELIDIHGFIYRDEQKGKKPRRRGAYRGFGFRIRGNLRWRGTSIASIVSLANADRYDPRHSESMKLDLSASVCAC